MLQVNIERTKGGPKANLGVLETRKLPNTDQNGNRGSSISVISRPLDGWSGYDSRQSQKLFSSPAHPDPLRGPSSVQCKGYCGFCPQGYIQCWD
jgi:hypothetical protein